MNCSRMQQLFPSLLNVAQARAKDLTVPGRGKIFKRGPAQPIFRGNQRNSRTLFRGSGSSSPSLPRNQRNAVRNGRHQRDYILGQVRPSSRGRRDALVGSHPRVGRPRSSNLHRRRPHLREEGSVAARANHTAA